MRGRTQSNQTLGQDRGERYLNSYLELGVRLFAPEVAHLYQRDVPTVP